VPSATASPTPRPSWPPPRTTRPGDPAALGYVAQRVHVLFWGLGRRAEARAFVERAAGWSDEPQWPQRLDPWRLVISGFVEGVDRYEEHADETERSLADPSLDARARRQAELAHIFRLMAVGRAKGAYALVRRNRPAVPLRDNYDASMLGLMCVIELEAGEDWSDLEAYATDALRDGVRADDHQAAGLGAFALAALAMARGRYRDAERWPAPRAGAPAHSATPPAPTRSLPPPAPPTSPTSRRACSTRPCARARIPSRWPPTWSGGGGRRSASVRVRRPRGLCPSRRHTRPRAVGDVDYVTRANAPAWSRAHCAKRRGGRPVSSCTVPTARESSNSPAE
jgi:hypothetical protein